MLKQMRENTKIVLWIVIAAFVGLIFAVWGADLTRTKRGGAGLIVGKVDGYPLTAEAYEKAYNEELGLYRGESDLPVLPSITALLRERAWNRLVNSAIVERELARHPSVISDEEVVYAIRTGPPDFIRQHESFQTDGQFDYNKYRAAIDDPTVDWRWLEDWFRQQLPYDHLRQRITASARIGETEMRDLYVQNNETATFSFVAFLPSEFVDEAPDVSDDEARAWYDGHQEDYRLPARASLDFVRLPVRPSEADREYLRTRMGDIINRIEEGTPFEDLARYYSEGGTKEQGGEIGEFRRGQLTPALEEAAFALDEGEVSGVIEGKDAFQIVQVIEHKGRGANETVRLRHILMKVETGGETVEMVRLAADTLRMEAEASDIRSAAEGRSYTVRRTPPFEEGENVPGLGEFRAANLFAFAGKPGDVSTPIFFDETYYVLSVATNDSSRIGTFEEVEAKVRREVVRRKLLARAAAEAEKYAGAGTAWSALESIARSSRREVRHADIVPRAGTVPGIGMDTELILAAFAAPDSATAGPYDTDYGSFFVRRDKIDPVDEERYRNDRPVLLRSLLSQRRDFLFNRWIEKKREEATIEDLRPAEPEMQAG